VRGQACGCVGEVCIGNKQIKGMLSSLNVRAYLSPLACTILNALLACCLPRAASSHFLRLHPPTFGPSSSQTRVHCRLRTKRTSRNCRGPKAYGQRKLQVIPDLIALLGEPDPATQRLAASALCNLSANHDQNKKLCREAGLIDALIKLVKTTTDDAVQVWLSESWHVVRVCSTDI